MGGRTVERRLRVDAEHSGQRLDRYLVDRFAELSRTRVHALIESGAVCLGSHRVRPSTRVAAEDEIVVTMPEPTPNRLEPEQTPLCVVYADPNLLVIDKPAGLVVHPAPGHPAGTLVNALLAYYPDLVQQHAGGLDAGLRPGIVHRLDKDTSGLMVVAKHERARRYLAAQLKERQMDKRYLALVDGAPSTESGTVDAPIARDPRRPQHMAIVAGGRPATTHFRVLHRYKHHTLLTCKPVTGRTHQLRVHLAAINVPVVADRLYGRKMPSLPLDRHFLHAARLTFQLPPGELGEAAETRTFEAPLPGDLQQVLESL